MGERDLQNFTLGAWLERTWSAYRRGVPLGGQDAILIKCMLHHSIWRHHWDGLVMGTAEEGDLLRNAMIHIHNDVTVMSQIQSGNPAEVKNLADMLTEKGFDEFAIVHSIGVALSEQHYHAKEFGEDFSVSSYTEKAGVYAKQLLARPEYMRRAKANVC